MRRKLKPVNRLRKTAFALALAAGLGLPVVSEATDHTVNNWSDFHTISSSLVTGDKVIFNQNTNILTNGVVTTIPAGVVISINGKGAIIDGTNGTSGMIRTAAGSLGSISNITFTNGYANAINGGAVYIGADLTGGIANSTFSNNAVLKPASGDIIGGAIYIGKTLTGGITNSTFTDNVIKANDNGNMRIGGAIYIHENLTGGIANSIFSNNSAGGAASYGGAIYVVRDLTGGIENSIFSNNTANFGGALHVNAIDRISNSVFTNNMAAGEGGAIYISCLSGSSLTLDSTGQGILFQGNMAQGSPNSIYFSHISSNFTNVLNIIGTGTIYMYDPLRVDGTNGAVNVNQQSGTWILGGANNTQRTTWNISGGTLILTEDSLGMNNASIKSRNFTLESGAALFVVPNTTRTVIDVFEFANSRVELKGTVGVANDERYRAYIDPADISNVLLTIEAATNVPFDNNLSTIKNPSGTFSLGQYDYDYTNLAWNGNDLQFNPSVARLNPERNGDYAAEGTLRSAIANPTGKALFGQMSAAFRNLVERDRSRVLWGIAFNNNMRTDQKNYHAGSSINTPGFILGFDRPVSENSFLGVAVSAAWPDYKQGSLKADGKDIRFAIYGGSKLKNSFDLGYFASMGFGDMNHKRTTSRGRLGADYDIKNYTLGLSLSKDIEKGAGKTLKPYLTYEFLKSEADDYTEAGTDTLSGITASKQNNSLSRLRLGAKLNREKDNGSYLSTGAYWQGLYGDRNATVTSYMTSTPESLVRLNGIGVARNSLGLDLTWGRKVGKSDFSLSYNGLFGKNTISNTFALNFMYKF